MEYEISIDSGGMNKSQKMKFIRVLFSAYKRARVQSFTGSSNVQCLWEFIKNSHQALNACGLVELLDLFAKQFTIS